MVKVQAKVLVPDIGTAHECTPIDYNYIQYYRVTLSVQYSIMCRVYIVTTLIIGLQSCDG